MSAICWLANNNISDKSQNRHGLNHEDIIKWKHSLHYWPFVRGIHQSPVISPHKGQWCGSLMFFFDLRLNKRLSKQSWGWWFEMPLWSLWRHIGSDNGLLPGRHLAITWTDVGILSIGPPRTNFSEMLIPIHTFSFKKIHLRMSSGKWRPFCLGLNVFTNQAAFKKCLWVAKYKIS